MSTFTRALYVSTFAVLLAVMIISGLDLVGLISVSDPTITALVFAQIVSAAIFIMISHED